MAIKTQTITMRQGNKSDYQPSKMLSGELAVINDSEELHFSARTGQSIRVATERDVEELNNKIASGGGGGNPGGNGGSIVVDSYLSETSTNPVQNKVVAKKFSELSGQIDDLKENGVVGSSIEPKEDDIPKVFFSEAIPQTKDYVVTKFRYISKTMDVSGYAEFKAQGNSSMNYPKKNFTVKLYADESLETKLKLDFKGWGEQSKFVLKANWIDITHSRNVVGARLWTQICETRKSTLPQLLQETPRLGSMDGFPVKVYSQGIYQGRYSWNIPKDKWAFNMDDSLDEHVVLCGESNNQNTPCVFAVSSDNINGTYWSDEIHDTVPSAVVTAWNRVLKFVNESTDEEFKQNVSNYINLDSVIDYWIFNVLFGNTDAYGKNQLWITYDLVNWFISAYDLDQFCGLDWTGKLAYAYDSSHPIIVAQYNNLILKLIRNFPNEITERYAELRENILSETNVINAFERFTDIAPLDLVNEDFAKTTANGAFTSIPSSTTNNIQQIRAWVVNRFALYDTLVPNFGVNTDGNADSTLYSVTYNLTNCTSDNTSESVVEGESYSATITANEGYNLDNVTVVHNGESVTVTNGSFTIDSVSGDIVITATATSVNVINLSGDDMTIMGTKTTYEDGVFVTDTQRTTISYNDGFYNYQICSRDYALGRSIALEYDYEVDSKGDGAIMNNIHLGDGTGPGIAAQKSSSPTTAGSTGTFAYTINNIQDTSFTMNLNGSMSHDYLGVKIMVTKGKVTISNLKVTVI